MQTVWAWGGSIPGRLTAHSRSRAAFKACSTSRRILEGRAPSCCDSFERSRVVTWWQTATLSWGNPALAVGRATTVNPRRPWLSEVDTGQR